MFKPSIHLLQSLGCVWQRSSQHHSLSPRVGLDLVLGVAICGPVIHLELSSSTISTTSLEGKAGNTHTIELGVGIRLFRKRSGRSTSAWPTSAMPNFAADLDEALIIGLHLGGVSAIPKAVGNEKTRLSRLRTRN